MQDYNSRHTSLSSVDFRTSDSLSPWEYSLRVLILVLALLLSWWWTPIGSILLCIAGGLVALWDSRRKTGHKYGSVIVIGAATPLLMEIVLHGRPAVWWFAGATAVAVAIHFSRPSERPVLRIVLTNARNAVISVAFGLAAVIAIQLTLHYMRENHAELARAWTFWIGEACERVEDIVFLGPKKLAVLLALLIATAVIAPSLRVVRNYRRVATVASHSLLALTVATSFMFFGNSYARTAEWIARLESARDHLGAIDRSNEEIVKAVTVERTLNNLPRPSLARLAILGQEIEKHPEKNEVRKRIADELVSDASRKELTDHVVSTRKQLEQTPASDELRASRERIEQIRQQVERGEAPSRADLRALGVERTRAQAVARETREGVVQMLITAMLPQSMAGVLVQVMSDGVLMYGRVPPTDRATATSAMHQASAEPPRVTFDHVLGKPRDRDDDLPEIVTYMAAVVTGTGAKIVTERQAAAAAATAKRASRSGRSYGGGHSSSGGTKRSRGGSRFGVRGGGPLLVA